MRKGHIQYVRVPLHLSPSTGVLGQHHDRAHLRRSPPEALGRDTGDEPHLCVERAEQPFHGAQLRLDLHDQERSAGRVPGEDVDGAALAVMREAHLHVRLP